MQWKPAAVADSILFKNCKFGFMPCSAEAQISICYLSSFLLLPAALLFAHQAPTLPQNRDQHTHLAMVYSLEQHRR